MVSTRLLKSSVYNGRQTGRFLGVISYCGTNTFKADWCDTIVHILQQRHCRTPLHVPLWLAWCRVSSVVRWAWPELQLQRPEGCRLPRRRAAPAASACRCRLPDNDFEPKAYGVHMFRGATHVRHMLHGLALCHMLWCEVLSCLLVVTSLQVTRLHMHSVAACLIWSCSSNM